MRWYRKAAEQGWAPAQGNLGCLYQDQLGTIQEAVKWYLKAENKVTPQLNTFWAAATTTVK